MANFVREAQSLSSWFHYDRGPENTQRRRLQTDRRSGQKRDELIMVLRLGQNFQVKHAHPQQREHGETLGAKAEKKLRPWRAPVGE